MTRGAKIGLLLALACGCSVRTLDCAGNTGITAASGAAQASTPARPAAPTEGTTAACDPAAGAAGGHRGAPPVSFQGDVTVGAPALLPGSPNPLGSTPRALAIGDLDGDGRPDLVASGPGPISGSVVSVSLNIGNGAFAPRVDHPVTAGSTSLALGDLSGDGRPDIVVGGEGGQGVEILFNMGGGRFRASRPVVWRSGSHRSRWRTSTATEASTSSWRTGAGRRPTRTEISSCLFNDGVNSFTKGAEPPCRRRGAAFSRGRRPERRRPRRRRHGRCLRRQRVVQCRRWPLRGCGALREREGQDRAARRRRRRRDGHRRYPPRRPGL